MSSDISEEIWKHFLATEFHFSIHDDKNKDDTTSSNGNNQTEYRHDTQNYLQCLKVSQQIPPTLYNDDTNNFSSNNEERERAISIFGYQASNIVYTANSAYESWRQWHIAKRRYCHGCPLDKIDSVRMNAPCK